MDEWQSMSEQRVRFEEASNGDAAHLRIVGSTGASVSVVGYRKDTVSTMELRNPEFQTVIRHEIGHVLGLHHEQRRSDRLTFIQVHTANVVDSEHCQNQFEVCDDCTDVDDYY